MISGGELGEQKAIASLIGEELLISILQDTPLNSNEDTHILHQVACEALGVLCRGPRSRQKQVLAAGAAKVYMTILRSKNPRVVIEVLRLVIKSQPKIEHFDWCLGNLIIFIDRCRFFVSAQVLFQTQMPKRFYRELRLVHQQPFDFFSMFLFIQILILSQERF